MSLKAKEPFPRVKAAAITAGGDCSMKPGFAGALAARFEQRKQKEASGRLRNGAVEQNNFDRTTSKGFPWQVSGYLSVRLHAMRCFMLSHFSIRVDMTYRP